MKLQGLPARKKQGNRIMSFISALIWFGLLTLMLIGIEIMYTYATRGFSYGFSANRPAIEKTPLGLRIQRSYQNQVEAAGYIVPVLAAGALSGVQAPGLATATLLVVIGRTAFAALYYTGVSFVRVPAFVLGTFPTLYIAIVLLMSAPI
jgi:uncharacterized MAPEG superfamily protein